MVAFTYRRYQINNFITNLNFNTRASRKLSVWCLLLSNFLKLLASEANKTVL